MKTSSLLPIVLYLATLTLASCAPQPPAVVDVTATPRPMIEVTSFPSTFKIDNVDIEFTGYKVDKDYFRIGICFNPPTQELWSFGDTVFSIENMILNKGPVISVTSDTDRVDGFHCGDIAYPIDLVFTGKAKLSIGQLMTSFHGNCDRAQRNLDEAETGIVVSCDPARVARDTGMGHTAAYVILKKPVFMNEVEAYRIAWDAFSEINKVDWKFTFHLEKP